MTTEELHVILDNENRKLEVKELKDVLYQLKQDCCDEHCKERRKKDAWKSHFYAGEVNAFYICLDLLEHLDIQKKEKENENLC